MNEELRIIIRAVTEDAERNLAEVRRELDNISDTGSESGKKLDDAMKAVGKGAAIAVAAFTALAAAVVALGKSSMEFRKEQAKLVAGFQSFGATAAQATETYRDLYRFLGETDTAVEAAQSLAKITTNQKELAEWSKILQGVYAASGNSLPVESLAEAANETIKVGKVTGTMADALNWVGVSEDAFNEKLAATVSLEEREVLVRSTLNSLYSNAASIYERNNQSVLRYNESQARLDAALVEATQYVVPLLTQLNNLAAALLTYLKPAFEVVSKVLIVFCQWIIAAIQYVGAFFGIFSEGNAATDEVADSIDQIQTNTGNLISGAEDYTGALEDATQQAKELKKQTMGFDELNIVAQPESTPSIGGGAAGGGGAGAGLGVAIPDIGSLDLSLPNMDEFKKDLEETEEKMKAVLVLVGLVAAGIAAWKLSKFLPDLINYVSLLRSAMKALDGKSFKNFKNALDSVVGKDKVAQLKAFGGTLLIIAGAIALVHGYTDAWANGIDWANLATMIGGVAAVVGGLYLAVGPMAAQIGLIVGGIALVVISIKDLITNGYSMEAVITLVIGVLAVVIGLIWAFNAALLANPITWIILAIVALVATFVILWNECDAFRNFWINLWDGIVTAFKATVAWFKSVGSAIATAFVTAVEAIKKAWHAVGDWFKGIGTSIKNVFSGIGQWFKNIFTSAANGVKNAFSAVGTFFSNLFTNIKNIFSNIGSTIGNAVSNAFKSAINWVLEKAIGLVNGFIGMLNGAIGIINKIPGVEISKISKLDVPKLAEGGVVNSATLALFGENGREAVLPLENNTEWMDALADRIAARNSTPSKVILKVGEKELGYATIGAINNITEQTGELPLVLV